MTKSRPKGPANRRLPTKASSTVTQGSPHQGQEEEEIEYQREEEGRARGEGQKRGHLEVKEGGRHKKSPRRGRKKKRVSSCVITKYMHIFRHIHVHVMHQCTYILSILYLSLSAGD